MPSPSNRGRHRHVAVCLCWASVGTSVILVWGCLTSFCGLMESMLIYKDFGASTATARMLWRLVPRSDYDDIPRAQKVPRLGEKQADFLSRLLSR